MEKLEDVTKFFDKLWEEEKDAVYTEDKIMEVLTELHLEQYGERIQDAPTRVVNEMFTEITNGACPRLNPNQEQEMLDFMEELLVNGKLELPIIAKALRYLLRKDKMSKAALLVVDVQNDFISGTLALRNTPGKQEGEEVVQVINDILNDIEFDAVFYSLDWHPEDHCSYHINVSKYALHESSQVSAADAKLLDTVVYDGDKVFEQVLWPVHCLQNSDGAKLHENLKVVGDSIKIYKGQFPNIDSYSVFWDNGRLSRSEILTHLFDNNITHIFICGLATDFCVGTTALHAAEHGFNVFVVMDACRGVADDTIEEMTGKMVNAGCELIQSYDIADKMSWKYYYGIMRR